MTDILFRNASLVMSLISSLIIVPIKATLPNSGNVPISTKQTAVGQISLNT